MASAEAEDPVLARFRGGEVLASDLERERLFVTRDEKQYRGVAGFSETQTDEDWIRRIALRRLARLELPPALAADPALQELARSQARNFALSQWHEACYGLPLETPSDQELLVQVAKLPPWPLRVKVYHIFQRVAAGEDPAQVRARLESWRPELRTLDDFMAKARDLSHSQSRRRGGSLGWIRAGMLAPKAEEKIFNLPVGSLSEPVEVRGGFHLFWIAGRREAEDGRDWYLEKKKTEALAEARKRCRQTRIDSFAGIRKLEEGQLRVGEYQIPLSQLPLRHGESQEAARQRFEEEEILFQLAQGPGGLGPQEKLRLVDLEDNVYLARHIETLAEARLGQPTPEALREIYGDGAAYRRPRHLAGTLLRVQLPSSGDPWAFFERAEGIATAIAGGGLSFAEASKELGGELTVFPLQSQLEVANLLGPPLFEEARLRALGSVVGPVQDADSIAIVRFDREEAQRRLSFEEALPDLKLAWRRAYLAQHKETILNEMLVRGKFRR